MSAIVLAGGMGSRLRGDVKYPKPLLPLHGETLLEHQIKWLRSWKFDQIIVATSKDLYRTWKKDFPKDVEYSLETKKLGTGGAVALAIEKVDRFPIYVMNVDDLIFSEIYSPWDLFDDLKIFNTVGSLLIWYPPLPFSIVRRHGNKITGFTRNPTLKNVEISIGHYAFSEDVFSLLDLEMGDLEDELLPLLASEGELACRILKSGVWKTVNDVKQYQDLLKFLEKRRRKM